MRASRAKVAALHETAIDERHLRGGELARLRLGALARRIEHDGVECVAARPAERPAEQVARLRLDRLQARCVRGRLPQRRDRGRVVVRRDDACALGKPQRERTDAAEQVGDAFSLCRHAALRAARAPPRLPPSPAGSAPGGSTTDALPMRTVGGTRCAISSPWRVRRASRCVSAIRASAAVCRRSSGPEPRTSTSSPASVAVTWMSSGFSVAPSASAIAHAARIAPPSEARASGIGRSARSGARDSAAKPTSSTSCRCAAHETPRAAGPRRAHRSARRPAHRAAPAPAPAPPVPRFQSR